MSINVKIILADDHPIVRQGLRQVIEREPDFIISAECNNGQEVLESLTTQPADILILDVDMPLMNGFEVLSRLQQINSDVKVILLTVHDEIEFYNEAMRLGAMAYILKECAIEDIVIAIRNVISGLTYSSSRLTQHLSNRLNQHDSAGISVLTPMEREILRMIADYKTNNEIGDKLFISPLTVKTHRRNISHKLNIVGNHALMKFALENTQLLYSK